jgi:predicted dehydrogenase
MKQVVQNLRSGVTELVDAPAPLVAAGHLLIATRASLISAGTERSLVEFGKASLVSKARQNPERVRQVLDKIKVDGLLPTLEAVFAKLDAPLPLGYCNAGIVVEVGRGVEGFAVGDRVASNGPHASVINQPTQLAAAIPDGVSFDEACFTPLAAIALQGVRLVAPQLGETVAVIGLGLVGLIAVQLLRANGCRVIAIDLDERRLALAAEFGAIEIRATSDVAAAIAALTAGQGVDAVLIAAAAKEDSIIHQAAEISRKRGRIVLVGAVNMQLNRADFYEKELTFQVSCSYGPGRYDAAYEEQGHDYPLAFVRWTEQRNFAAVLELMAAGKLDVRSLVTSRISHAEAARAYEALSNDRSQLGIVFQYPDDAAGMERVIRITERAQQQAKGLAAEGRTAACKPVVGVIGAGNFTLRALLPALTKAGAHLAAIASAGGLSATHAARKFGIARATSDYRTLLADPDINTVFIATRHNSHARMVVEALDAGKHVFVEKPLAIDDEQLAQVRAAYERIAAAGDARQLMVGFNRRFAPDIVKMKQLLADRRGAACATILVNAGHVPADQWAQDRAVGGGRMIGEGCHWIDLLRFLVGAPITNVQSTMIDRGETRDDHATVSLGFADGSIGTLHYFANGHRSFPKERIEVFADGRVLQLDNFRVLRGFGWPGFRKLHHFRQAKGHEEEVAALLARIVQGGPPLIAADELWNVTEASFEAAGMSRGTPQNQSSRAAESTETPFADAAATKAM